MSAAQTLALSDIRSVARALVRLGGTATAQELADACNLSLATTVRRLTNAGYGRLGLPALFRCEHAVRPVTRGNKKSVWHLTSSGAAMAREEEP